MESIGQKEALRQDMREKRRIINLERAREESELIQHSFLSLAEFDAANTIGCYLALPGEVRTDDLLQACWESGRTLYVPAYDPDLKAFAWATLQQNTRLVTGPWHTKEPEHPELIKPGGLDLLVIPGMAFDPGGARLGHGGGFYDRLLAKEQGAKVALAFQYQMVPRLPVDTHDERVDLIVTEETIYHCNK